LVNVALSQLFDIRLSILESSKHNYSEQFYIIDDFVYYMSEESWNELWLNIIKQPFNDNAKDFTLKQINRDNKVNSKLDLKGVIYISRN